MAKKPVPRHKLKEIPFVVARDDGRAILLRFILQSGQTIEFECRPQMGPELAAKLFAAVNEAAARNPLPHGVRCDPVVAPWFQIGLDDSGMLVTLTLFPSQRGGVGFALAPDTAHQISAGLAAAAAMVAPKDRSSLS